MVVTVIKVASNVIIALPRTIAECMDEVIRSFANVSIASMIAVTVGQMLMECTPL